MQQNVIASFIILHLAIVTNLCYCQYVNVNVERKLNLTSHAPKYNIEVSFRPVDSTTTPPYLIAIPTGVYQKLAYINVSSNSNKIKTTKSSNVRPNGYEILSVKYHDLLNIAQAKTQLRLHIEMIFTNVYEYLPKSIQQDENQLVVYTSARVFSSPYITEKQITTISLASHHIEEVSEDTNIEINGDTLTYGPYYNVKPYIDGYNSNGEKDTISAIDNKASEETMYNIPVRLHFENNNPSIYSRNIETEITIGSTTTARVKTFVEIENHGATLYGGFSRLDYQMRRLDYVGPSFQQLRFQLLKSFCNLKCNDDIGNLTKAYIDYNTSSLMLDTRYPIFGGWKSDFTVTYDIQLLTEIIDFSDYNNYRNKKQLKIKF